MTSHREWRPPDWRWVCWRELVAEDSSRGDDCQRTRVSLSSGPINERQRRRARGCVAACVRGRHRLGCVGACALVCLCGLSKNRECEQLYLVRCGGVGECDRMLRCELEYSAGGWTYTSGRTRQTDRRLRRAALLAQRASEHATRRRSRRTSRRSTNAEHQPHASSGRRRALTRKGLRWLTSTLHTQRASAEFRAGPRSSSSQKR